MSIVRAGPPDGAHPRLGDAAAPAPLGRRREEVLARLRAAEHAVSAAQVAASARLHVNTARFHLDGLVESGHAERRTERSASPGRPRVLYAPRQAVTAARSFGLLAEMLAGLVASLDADGTRAAETGRAWGRHLVARPGPAVRLSADDARTRLDQVLSDIGFEQESDGAADDVRISHCPFLEVAREHPHVVCAVHRGLMQGALEELRAPIEVAVLEPFVGPHLCRARLRPAT